LIVSWASCPTHSAGILAILSGQDVHATFYDERTLKFMLRDLCKATILVWLY